MYHVKYVYVLHWKELINYVSQVGGRPKQENPDALVNWLRDHKQYHGLGYASFAAMFNALSDTAKPTGRA